MARGRKKGKHSWDGYSKKDQASKWLRTLAEAQYQLRRSGSTSAAAAAAATTKASAAASNANGGWLQKFRRRHQGGGSYGNGAGAAAARMNAQAAARFVELYLRGPPSAAPANLTASVAAGGKKGDGTGHMRNEKEEEEGIALEEWLWRETKKADSAGHEEKEGEAEKAGKEGGKEEQASSPVVSLTELCCRQVGADLALYGAACAVEEGAEGRKARRDCGTAAVSAAGVAPPARRRLARVGGGAASVDAITASIAATHLSVEQGHGADSTTISPCASASGSAQGSNDDGTDSSSHNEAGDDDEEDDDEDDNDENSTADAIRGIFSLLPSECLARISLAASLSHAVTDASLPLLCQPSALRLVLVGSLTDAGLARAMFPRLRQLPTTASWEDATLEPQLGGCVLLQSLLVSSPRLTPWCVKGIGRHLTTVRSLALPRCFNANVTTTAREVLSIVAASCGYVQELDLRGCQWLSEKSLVEWARVGGSSTAAAPATAARGGKIGGGSGGNGRTGGYEGQEGKGGRMMLGGKEREEERVLLARVMAFDGPAPIDGGPPQALRRLYLDKELAKREGICFVFASMRDGVSGGESGSESRKGLRSIEVCTWEAGGKEL